MPRWLSNGSKKERAGPALGISAIGSFIGGTLGIVVLMFLIEPLAAFAMEFGPPEYFWDNAYGPLPSYILSKRPSNQGCNNGATGSDFGMCGYGSSCGEHYDSLLA